MLIVAAGALLLFGISAGAGFAYFQNNGPQTAALNQQESREQENKYVAFLMEVYDKIQKHYWQDLSEAELSQKFQAGAEKLIGQPLSLSPANRQNLANVLENQISALPEDKKQEFTTKLSDFVLRNLQPNKRSRLYTQKQEKELSQKVKNIDKDKGLYKALGLQEGASIARVEEAYQKTKKELKDKDTKEAKEKLEKAEEAKKVLAEKENKQRYDKTGAKPTVYAEKVHPNITYIRLEQFSPATLEEFQKEAREVLQNSQTNPDSLILDLRSNIGGAIDILPYFLGPFIGPDSYAYEFFSQGQKKPFKTKTGWIEALVPYKKVAVLVNGGTQSSGEVMAGALKKYNVGVIVGKTTKGWGTVEQVFDIENQINDKKDYSMFLVHSVTLRPDGQPIEGRGISPDVNITQNNWKQQLAAHFNYEPLIQAVEKTWQNRVQEK